MKNYYENLNVERNASQEQIKAAYDKIPETLRTSANNDAYSVLGDPESRKKYDEQLAAYEAKKEKKSSNKKVKVYAGLTLLLLGLTGGGIALANKNDKNKDNDTKVEATATPGITKAPSVTVTPKVTATPVPTVTPAPTPTPIVAENVEVIESANIDVVSKYLADEYAKKGFVVETNDLRAALSIAGIENTKEEELEDIFANTTVDAEFDKASSYCIYLTTHNLGNCVYGKDVSKYVCVSDLVYNNETSKAIVNHFDELTIWLLNSMNDGTLTQEKFDTVVKYVFNFYNELDSFEIDGKEYSYTDCTDGDLLLVQMGNWPVFFAACRTSDFATEETTKIIDSINKKEINGLDYVSKFKPCQEQTTYTFKK